MTGSTRLDPQLRTVGELFDDSDVVYTIPVYQRNFAWRAEQIEQLIDDIQDAIIDRADGYFLGNLIVTERGSASADFEVIDGQQRLTTLYLLLAVLAQDGSSPYGAHRDRIRYESRPRATEAMRRVATDGLHHMATPGSLHDEDTGIHQAFNVIRQFINQHEELRHEADRDRFANFLRGKVTVVRASLPVGD